ncbi:class I SAM-dependent methyltransferase [Nostoc sp. XA010]|uniref:class I SAM-dependent methyltransferase n=1 Tax=Nostoc sp. XA010 TaxID=2780407 RepID=UPI001E60FC6E|nr:methyltransferase domain-containing protein [Nostoc sp. XA010]MCC5661238.1 class I SAM-dependent methyltransferase [Nostoc sp. XA010]
MKNFYVASGFLTVKDSQVWAVFDWKQNKTQAIDNKNLLTILEIFIHEKSLEVAYQKFQKVSFLPISQNVLQKCKQVYKESNNFIVLIADRLLKVVQQGFVNILNPDKQYDLDVISQESFQVMRCLFSQESFAGNEQEISSFETFKQSVEYLATLGLLSPAVSTLEWGDLRRSSPLCPLFGFTRGTPIDRYYLGKFIKEIRHQVVGTVMELGGILQNRELYQFSDVTEYQTLDVAPRPGVTQIGDVHDLGAITPESLDAIVVFNVLEHCHNPWVVIQNIYNWLKVGGQCFCLVPSAQRLHDMPGDYWRPLPDGMKQLFRDFSQQKLSVYGNPLTVVASFMGISAEELLPHELDNFHPDYPVVTCIVAKK